MDNLNKQQVILLALLVAFVTSISTGIVVASLMDKSYESVTSTIYKVVERTIQEVAPESSVAKKIGEKSNTSNNTTDNSKSNPSAQEKPLMISDVAEKAGNSIFKIYDYSSEEELKEMVSVGVRFADNLEVIGLTPLSDIYQGKRFLLVAADGIKIKAKLTKIGKNGYSTFVIDEGQNTNVSISKSVGLENQKIGYSIVSFGAKAESNVVSTGIISSIESEGQIDRLDDSEKDFAITDIRPSSRFSGFVLLSTNGEVAGLIISSKEGDVGARYIDPKFIKAEFPTAF